VHRCLVMQLPEDCAQVTGKNVRPGAGPLRPLDERCARVLAAEEKEAPCGDA
jgi:hypothetical protein